MRKAKGEKCSNSGRKDLNVCGIVVSAEVLSCVASTYKETPKVGVNFWGHFAFFGRLIRYFIAFICFLYMLQSGSFLYALTASLGTYIIVVFSLLM